MRARSAPPETRACTLTIAANYGGRWDMLQAINAMVREQPERRPELHRGAISSRTWR